MSHEVRRADDRFRTEAGGRTTWHSFAFGEHYDPDDVGFGALVAHNDETLPPGTGYPDHAHRDLEIVSVVLTGALRHDSEVGSGVLGPGEVQRLSAGAGVRHSETAAHSTEPTRFLQSWVRPTQSGTPATYDKSKPASGSGWVPLVGGDAELGIDAPARLLRARLTGSDLALPDAPRLHLFCVSGDIEACGERLGPSDALRLVGETGTVVGTGEVLLWALE